jgi:DNA-binding NarL/FixJ family response regulator
MSRILLIEDEAPLRANLAALLRFENHEVIEAGDGAAGLRLARERAPALILCDVMMPEMDGHQVLQALRSDSATRAIPFVFLTARGAVHELREGMTMGADDYLIKPVGRDELVAAVATRLARHRELQTGGELSFNSPTPLLSLGLTLREAEVLLWVAQGKTNSAIGVILGMTEGTVKKHLQHIFEKGGFESRGAAAMWATERLLASSKPNP